MLHHSLRSAVISYNDPNFESVVLLCPGNGTNGAQNNTFIDGSTNNFTITRNGNTTQGTFSPYGSNWSNYFDGSGDYLNVADNAALDFGTGDFTIELWFNTSRLASQAFIAGWSAAAPVSGWAISVENSVPYFTTGVNDVYIDATNSTSISVGQWYHIAAVRSSGTVTLYVNGVAGTPVSNSTSVNTQASGVNIGRSTYTLNLREYQGYISNLRILKGTALYTTNFTPPTAPLTAITNTSLLTCQSNRFIDNSSNNFTITRTGDVSVSRFSPFEPGSSYSATVIGGSGYFDGTGDYLTTPSNTAFTFGTGDFCYELWVFHTVSGASEQYADQNTNGFSLSKDTANKLSLAQAGVAIIMTSVGTIPINKWVHVSVTRSGTSVRMFIDGVLDSTATLSTNFSPTSSLYIGRQYGAAVSYITGYVSNLRVVKGSAVYTAAFTPPTAPLTAITNTSLLLNFTNAAIIDNAMINVAETVGNAQISTTQSKWGGSSMYFDGAGDYLVLPNNVLFSFGTADFTVEAWVWLDSTVNPGRPDNLKTVTVFSTGTSSADCSFAIYGNTTTAGIGLELYQTTPSIAITAAITVPTNTWAHIAFVRSGTTIYGFVNGTRVTLGTTSSSIASNVSPKIATANTTSYLNQFKGYIDDLRVTKGVARYTAAFTPPLLPFPTR